MADNSDSVAVSRTSKMRQEPDKAVSGRQDIPRQTLRVFVIRWLRESSEPNKVRDTGITESPFALFISSLRHDKN